MKDQKKKKFKKKLLKHTKRIAGALERMSPKEIPLTDLHSADAFVWDRECDQLVPVFKVQHVGFDLLHGIDQVASILFDNTKHFAEDLPANNALLWGARGMGKSSLVKAVHAGN